jgi:hypothetical protein
VAAQREEARVCFGLDLVIKRRWREWLRLAWPWGKAMHAPCVTRDSRSGRTHRVEMGLWCGLQALVGWGGFFFSFVLLSYFGANKGRQEGFRKDFKKGFKDFKN